MGKGWAGLPSRFPWVGYSAWWAPNNSLIPQGLFRRSTGQRGAGEKCRQKRDMDLREFNDRCGESGESESDGHSAFCFLLSAGCYGFYGFCGFYGCYGCYGFPQHNAHPPDVLGRRQSMTGLPLDRQESSTRWLAVTPDRPTASPRESWHLTFDAHVRAWPCPATPFPRKPICHAPVVAVGLAAWPTIMCTVVASITCDRPLPQAISRMFFASSMTCATEGGKVLA